MYLDLDKKYIKNRNISYTFSCYNLIKKDRPGLIWGIKLVKNMLEHGHLKTKRLLCVSNVLNGHNHL
jgi:hypothetical protein